MWSRRRWRSLLWRLRFWSTRFRIVRPSPGEVRAHRWHVPWFRPRRLFPLIAATVLLGWVGFSAANLVWWALYPGHDGFSAGRVCGHDFGTYCGVVTGFITPWLTLGLLFVGFLLYRYTRVRWTYQNDVKTRPRDLVPTAGSIIGDVVGREQLCNVLMNDVRERETRRPHILVGSVGAGKTAVLVRLAELLARYNVVPVAIRLREAPKDMDLDFQEMACERLKRAVDPDLRANADADKIWRQLRWDNRVVVLADGLEEALVADKDTKSKGREGNAERDRDTVLRQAIDQAAKQDLPLIIASRPHDPLRGTRAIITELEPLGQGPALEYLTNGDVNKSDSQDGNGNESRLRWLVGTAEIATSPLYMQIIQDLNRAQRLWDLFPRELLPAGDSGGQASRSQVGRSVLRRLLLRAWRRALVDGYLYRDYALDTERRRITVEVLSALACVGLRKDSLEVAFEDLIGPDADDGRNPGNARLPGDNPPHKRLQDDLVKRLGTPPGATGQRPYDLSVIATMGAELGIVEARSDGVRFRHSIIQAYLGSRYLGAALSDDGYRKEAFRCHGREFLLALVLSAAKSAAARFSDATATNQPARYEPLSTWRTERDEANGRRDMIERATAAVGTDVVGALNIFAAAFEIDSISDYPDPATIIDAVADKWEDLSGSYRLDRAVDEAKLELIHRFGDAVRAATLRDRRAGRQDDRVVRAYRTFYELMSMEKQRSIRLAAALEIGKGGKRAFNALSDLLAEYGPQQRDTGGWTVPSPDDGQGRRKCIMAAWLAPLLYWSAGDDETSEESGDSSAVQEKAQRRYLDVWLGYLAQMDPSRLETSPSISLEISLAQGFKLTANQRKPYSSESARRRAVLMEKARSALEYSRFWFSHLTLIQALTLASLPDRPEAPLPERGRGSRPKKRVDYWVSIAGTRRAGTSGRDKLRPHPFVLATAAMCTLALQTRRPAEFCWMDERTVSGHIGSYSTERQSQYGQDCWIMESVGWTTLYPTAQQLLADVILMLNLTGRDGELSKMDERLKQADRRDLPPCLTADRRAMDPDRALGSAQVDEPSSYCLPSCEFQLCPYPPRGAITYSEELDEGFCNRQIYLLRPLRWFPLRVFRMRHRAHWEGVPRRQLRYFWWRMSQRTRPTTSEVPNPSVVRRARTR